MIDATVQAGEIPRVTPPPEPTRAAAPTPGSARRGAIRRSRRLLSELGPHLVLATACLVLFRDGLFDGRVFAERDTELFYAPLTRWVVDQLRSGVFPLWLPLIFGGYPIFADGEVGMLYPLNVIALLPVSQSIWLTLQRATHLFLAGSFMMAFARTIGIDRFGALIGGLVFAFGSFFITQLHHENLVRSAIWLPLILALVERSLQSPGWSRQRLLVGAGLTLGVAGLGLHVQPLAMTVLVLGCYVAFRLLWGPVAGTIRERLVLLVWVPGLVLGVGIGLAAAQWLPLFELGRMSYRGPGLGYDLASTWPLRWQNLATVVFPYLFRLDDGRYVTLWQQWETFLYLGIPTLALIAIAALYVRRRLVVFFALVGVAGLMIGLAEQSPVNLHYLLWSLPGFSSLRAPGRYAYLVVFAAAGLAAFGAEWLFQLRRRSWAGLGVGSALVAAIGALVWLMSAFRSRLIADPVRWKQLVDDVYMAGRREHGWLEGQMVYQRLIDGLSLSEPKTALSLMLLAATAVLILVWSLLPRRRMVLATALVGLLAGDLLSFGYDFHPLRSLELLTRPTETIELIRALGDDGRVFADPALAEFEPNRTMFADLPSVTGYSSLQTQRHFEYWSRVARERDVVLDLWSVRYVVAPDPPSDVRIVAGTAYRPYNALFNGADGNRTGLAEFALAPFGTVEVRVLATLVDSVYIAQGEAVAEIELISVDGRSERLVLRAGEHVAENAYDRADVRPLVRHERARLASTIPDLGPAGLPTETNLYQASFALSSPDFQVARALVRQVHRLGQTRIFGLGLVNASGQVRSIFSTDRAQFRPIYRAGTTVVLENSGRFPRAYVVPDVVARRSRSEESALPRLVLRPIDVGRQVILEEGPLDDVVDTPLVGELQIDPHQVPEPAQVLESEPNRVVVKTPPGPGGVLVLTDAYHRGWRARVDGVESPVYLANFLFRAVRLPPGEHVVEFIFDPLSSRIGMVVALSVLAFSLTFIVGSFLMPVMRSQASK